MKLNYSGIKLVNNITRTDGYETTLKTKRTYQPSINQDVISFLCQMTIIRNKGIDD